MNFGGNAAFDQAEQRAEQEREANIAAAYAAVAAPGEPVCRDRKCEISDERRAAAPFARRCVECQEFLETEKWHR